MAARRSGVRGPVARGVLLVSWGAILLGTNVWAERWPLEVWWPTLLLALGLFFVADPSNRYGWAVLSMLSGAGLQAHNLQMLSWDLMVLWWPMGLVGLGVWMIGSAFLPDPAARADRTRLQQAQMKLADQFNTVVSEPQLGSRAAPATEPTEASRSKSFRPIRTAG